MHHLIGGETEAGRGRGLPRVTPGRWRQRRWPSPVEGHSRDSSEGSGPGETSLGFGFLTFGFLTHGGHSGPFQLQQSELLGALEGSGELQVIVT